MKILVDENIPLTSVRELRHIRGTGQEGISDELLFSKACQEKKVADYNG